MRIRDRGLLYSRAVTRMHCAARRHRTGSRTMDDLSSVFDINPTSASALDLQRP